MSMITAEGKVVDAELIAAAQTILLQRCSCKNVHILELIRNQILLDSRKGCYSILTVFKLVSEGAHVNNLYFATITI